MTRFQSYRWAASTVTVLGLFATTVTAFGQPPRPAAPPTAPADPLGAAKAQQTIAEQKAESEINLQIDNADKLAKSGRIEQAVKTLNNAKANLQIATGISEAARTRLTGMLDAKLAAVNGKVTTPPASPLTPPGFKLDPKGEEVKKANAAAVERYFAENKDVRSGIERVADYNARGMTAQANAEIARLAKAYPNNPSVLALGNQESMQERLANAQAHYAAMADRWVKNQENINKSSLPAITEMEFPKDWKKKSEARLNNYGIKLSDKEKKIIEALDKPITISFNDRPFDEALQDLSNKLDQPLLLDKKSLDDLGVDLKKGATLDARGLSGRTVLRSILGAQGLTFVVKDEAIQIVTVEKAKSMLVTRVYYLGDLVQGVGDFGGIQWGPFINAQQTQANVDMLVGMIKKIDPLSWQGEGGGAGTITYHAPTQSIIVRNSSEVHHSLSTAFSPKNK